MALDILVTSWTVFILLAIFVPHFPGWLEWSRENHHLSLTGFVGVWLLSWVPSIWVPGWSALDVFIMAFIGLPILVVLTLGVMAKEKERQDIFNAAAKKGIGPEKLVMPKGWSAKKRAWVWFACWGGGVLVSIFLGDYILKWPEFTFAAVLICVVGSWWSASRNIPD